MNEISTVKYAIIDKNNRLMKVGSSRRPATFATLENAESKFDYLSKYHNYNGMQLVKVWYEPYKMYKEDKNNG